MAVEYQSRSFKDISLSFKKHPVTKDILVLKNEDAIKKSVINLVRTRLGDRFFDSNIGSTSEDILFSLGTLDTDYGFDSYVSNVKTLIANYEPRVKVDAVNFSLVEESNSVEITITYNIIGISDIPQSIQILI
jgi:phage baseplate assembly protein W